MSDIFVKPNLKGISDELKILKNNNLDSVDCSIYVLQKSTIYVLQKVKTKSGKTF